MPTLCWASSCLYDWFRFFYCIERRLKIMPRQYSSSFRPSWAVKPASTPPSQSYIPPKTETSTLEIPERDGSPTQETAAASSGENGDLVPPRPQTSSLKSNSSTLRSYSKFCPSSWTLPTEPTPPPISVIDYGYPPEAKSSFSPSGEGDAAPQPPEGFNARTYSAPVSQPSAGGPNPEPSYGVPPKPPISGTVPWGPWHQNYGALNAPRIGYGRPANANDTPFSTASTSSAGNDVPANAPHVPSTYSADPLQ